MGSLPTGVITFLLTDIEGSTRLWERYRPAMSRAVARHDAIAAEVVGQHGGALVKPRGEGDSLFIVFERPTSAVAAACALQQAFAEEPWLGAIPIRVRMALHTGEADLRDGDYYGPVVNRCARIRQLAEGGQVLLSQVTYQLVRDHLPTNVGVVDLGEHELRDMAHGERIFLLGLGGAAETATSTVPTGVVGDTGAWVLLGDALFLTESVTEDDAGEIRVQIAPRTGAEDAALGRLRSDLERPRGPIRYAHQNDAGGASVRMARKETVAGKAIWTIILRLDSRSQGSHVTEWNTQEMTADEMVAARARILLLGERPALGRGLQDKMILGAILGFGENKAPDDLFPRLWVQHRGEPERFLVHARLLAVYHLKATGTVEHIVELALGPVQDGKMRVRFRGERRRVYESVAPVAIQFDGMCCLETKQ